MSAPKVLVIDDEEGICRAVQRALRSENLQVDIATSGGQGLQRICSDGYDLVLLDIMMPDINGIDLIASIHAHDPEIVCIIITGYGTVELAVQAIKQGAYDFLTKPFSVDTLLLAVRQGLERRRLSLEAKRASEMEAETRRLMEEQERLLELDRAKQRFIRLVTHELKAPVAAIQYYLNLLQDGYVPPEGQGEIIQACMARAEEELALIDDLLELGRLQTISPQSKVAVSLSEVARQVLERFQPEAAQKGIRLDVSIEDVPPILGTPDQFKSLWSNLISNAIKYTPERGCVSVSLRTDGVHVIGQVSDTGIGIPPDEQKNLFTEFFRARNVKDSGIPGTGLGLVIVKRAVEDAGGTIEVKSEAGRGTTFTFVLPIQQAQQS